ncbi:ABC transporter substrate-binding protein [Nocardia terpenica]|uniref:ABC transporter substrate-binding protein n=1 Tax=Nocardia terpenica TaxID=455432 RepID=UPI001892D616|nr:ABC transporter substrate-binding protein [Nocardia terpenica]MBF6061641.1 ABC transporter substrate-binding protein [Nocardia terpenica]MBF6107564.1 ABC transporter substrate-binding protein [Nocardia terpenica]MBF6110061.1 ABC transporter substrate-binding protein [Nocardia terpenica]MBF6122427.1 ABC transporter substrate-binding protein [Nocardia terpenica]MBF6151397.1 ABC transporter substrate-binding protein [Nocardia terpenica]
MKSARRPRYRWARAAVVVLAGALAVALTGCGSAADDSGASDGAAVVIDHARGSTTVHGTPKRIVALGSQWLDTTVALGMTPVGYIDNIAAMSREPSPWLPTSLDSARKLQTTGKIDEQVAALNPDLILVDGSFGDQKTYDTLSKIAPTIPALGGATITPWPDQVRTLGKVLHRSEIADKVIGDVNARLDGLVAKNPGLKGKTFVSTWLAAPSQLMVLTDPNDGSSQVFGRLGLTIPPTITALPANQGRAQLSTERVNELNADLLIAGYSPGMDEKYRQLPGYTDLPAVHNNAVAFLPVQEISAINQPTALSLPYILNKITPALENAAK